MKNHEQHQVDFLHASEKGFSLIEVLISVVVLVFGLVSIVGITVYVSRANSTSNTLNIFAAAAQDQVDRLRTAVWTSSTEDPMLAVGGSIPSTPSTPYVATTPGDGGVAGTPLAAGQTPSYTYTLNPDNPHQATVTNTPIGELRVSWQVRGGSTPDIRFVTIKVEQMGAPSNLSDGFTVSTIITKN